MDSQLRILERRAAFNPAALPQLLTAAARTRTLSSYKEHLPFYFREIAPEAINQDFEAINFGCIANHPRHDQFLAYFRKVIDFHVQHKGSANFAPVGYNSRLLALAAASILKNYGICRGLIVVSPYVVAETTYAAQQFGLNPEPFSNSSSRLRTSGFDIITQHFLTRRDPMPIDYDIVIVDGHYLRNQLSKRSQRTYQIARNAIYKIITTSTPIVRAQADAIGYCKFFSEDFVPTEEGIATLLDNYCVPGHRNLSR